MKILIRLFLSLFALLLVSCVAGGSGLFLKAKKESGKVVLSAALSAYGGANLRKYDMCLIEYRTPGSKRKNSVYAVEVWRKKERVEWEALINPPASLKTIYVTTKIFSRKSDQRVYQTTWVVNPKDLSSCCKPLGSSE